MRILVAGALGEVGRTVSSALAERGHDILAASSRAPVPGSTAVSLEQAARVVADGDVGLVVNAAGRGDRRLGERSGIDATDVLGSAVSAAGVPAVLLSTLRVLEGYTEAVPEDAPPRPVTSYAQANALNEERWLAAAGAAACVLRVANYFCAPLTPDSPQALLLPWSLVTEALASGSISVRSGPQTTREFVSADDVARALEVLSLERPPTRVCATSPGWRASLATLVDVVREGFARTGLLEPAATFGTDGREGDALSPGWLAARGWSSTLDATEVTGAIAQWLAEVRLD